MIEIRATAAGIKAITYTGSTPWERNVENLSYQAIAPLVERIDRKLQQMHARVVRQLSQRPEGDLGVATR
jgi:hypothetical protein